MAENKELERLLRMAPDQFRALQDIANLPAQDRQAAKARDVLQLVTEMVQARLGQVIGAPVPDEILKLATRDFYSYVASAGRVAAYEQGPDRAFLEDFVTSFCRRVENMTRLNRAPKLPREWLAKYFDGEPGILSGEPGGVVRYSPFKRADKFYAPKPEEPKKSGEPAGRRYCLEEDE